MPYAGTILRVDLTRRKIEKEPTSSFIKDYIGGLSIATKILWDEVPPEVHGLDPKNLLIFATGPLTGTLLGNKCVIVSKSPLFTNKSMANAGMGGQFPSEMKFAGYDLIVVSGKADEPVYLSINNGEVEIKDAKHIWGSDVYKTQAMIKEELKDPDTQIACIGPAGENMVAFALVLHDIENTASRTGQGAVMGSKNLKAVAVRGTRGLKIADPEKFMDIWKEYWEYYTKGKGSISTKIINREGVSVHYDLYLDQDMHAWGNFDSFVVPPRKKEEEISDFLDKHLAGRIGCAFCPAQCHDNYDVAGLGGGGATCMFYTGFRWVVKNKDLKVWWRVNQLCQALGMETLCASGITSWLMDLYERKIITDDDTDGVPMEWGSEAACTAVLKNMANREGFGALLADGIVPAAHKIGRGSMKYAVQYRNMSIHPGFGPIGASGAVNMIPGASEVWNHPPGGDLQAIYPLYSHELGVTDGEAQQMASDQLSEFAQKHTGDKDSWKEDNYEKYADFIIINETAISVCDIAGHCDWYSDRVPQIGMWWGPKETAKAITASTGIKTTEKMLIDSHRRRRLLELIYFKLCKDKFGERDEVPFKLLRPRPDGKFKGATLNLAKIPITIRRYYELMGMDPETQLPTREELERLGLKNVADMLEKPEAEKPSA